MHLCLCRARVRPSQRLHPAGDASLHVAPRRYDHQTGCITLTSERHAHREDNRRELLRLLHALIAEGHRAFPSPPRPDLGLAWAADGSRIDIRPAAGAEEARAGDADAEQGSNEAERTREAGWDDDEDAAAEVVSAAEGAASPDAEPAGAAGRGRLPGEEAEQPVPGEDSAGGAAGDRPPGAGDLSAGLRAPAAGSEAVGASPEDTLDAEAEPHGDGPAHSGLPDNEQMGRADAGADDSEKGRPGSAFARMSAAADSGR
jgi:hypothetical protein